MLFPILNINVFFNLSDSNLESKNINGSLVLLIGLNVLSASSTSSLVLRLTNLVLANPLKKSPFTLTTSLPSVYLSKNFLNSSLVNNLVTSSRFTSLTFNIIREKYGACYSVGTQIISSPDAYGFDYGLQVSDMENFPKYL